MKRRSLCFSLVIIIVGFAISCSSNSATGPSSTPASPSATLASITVSGGTNLTTAGQQGQLTATAHYSDGTTQDVTAGATWQSSNGGIATVSAAGVVTAVGSGTATITVTYQGKSATFGVTITISTVSGSTLTATIDGVVFNGLGVSVDHTTAGGANILSIGGASGFTGNYILLAIAFPASTGTYAIGMASPANGSVQIPNQGSLWQAVLNNGSGTITVTSVTANSATGTFSLVLVPLPGTKATGSKIVTNGVFNVKF
jgi:Big-like domain-containing protein